jgi:hypothetical protein
MISQDLISDQHFNSISIESQNIFIRMLTVADDCGVVPANEYRLNVLINTPKKIIPKIGKIIDEIVKNGLGYLFEYNNEKFFAFKPSSFRDYQSYILKKATKSEYLRIPKEEFLSVSKNFQELPRISGRVDESALSTVESKEYKVESIKYKDNRLIVPENLIEEFCSEFSRELYEKELPKMEKWLRFNKPKKDYKRFIFNWLNKGSNDGRTTNAGRPAAEPGKYDKVVIRGT